MAHIWLLAPDVSRKVAFYTRSLALRFSDKAAGVIAFMHRGHGSDHHMATFTKSQRPGVHHCKRDVTRSGLVQTEL
jgi:catechol 2,3-dioxygenase-like lactoylglutathione lyase family enzyme